MLIIHTALHAEARALIHHYRLKRQHDIQVFPCFAADNKFLIESGIGKINTATAIGWVAAQLQCEQPVWLNFGMAGHAEHELGTSLLAHRIEDQASGQRFYPPQLMRSAPAGENLLTVDQPQTDYPHNCMVDMEASAFINAASRFSTLELIHSFKVISDNRRHPPERMKASVVEELMSAGIEHVDSVSEQLLSLRRLALDETAGMHEQLLQRWHFSQYQRGQLQRLVQRYHALHQNNNLPDDIPDNIISSKQLLNWLENSLSAANAL